MIAKNLISSEIRPVKLSDTGSEILALMSVFHVQHLPIVEKGEYVGIISEEDIFQDDDEKTIEALYHDNKSFVLDNDHIFEIMSVLAQEKLSIIPVVNAQKEYLGCITQEDLLHFYATSFSFTESGSLLVLETAKKNYSLVEISSIVEQENGVILGTHLSSQPNSNLVQITIKINMTNIEHIIASFERYGYTIIGSFYEDEYMDNLKSRYDALMNYLSI